MSVVVQTSAGAIRGQQADGVMMFKGIAFAQPPVGPLRFLPPRAVQPWRGVVDATRFGSAPIQAFHPAVSHRREDMDEDCLYLNVWAPASPGPHPVLVWIHGGAQTFGSTQRPEYDGRYFASHGVVCITVGYRLGAFGFLELGPWLGEAYQGSANNALRDIVMALQWVRAHVSAFGGDPGQVTLGGESAGAKNATTMLSVPAAQGLFQRMVVLSGGADTWQTTTQACAVTEHVLKEAGVACGEATRLLTLPADDVLKAQESVIAQWPSRFPFRPVLDGTWMHHAPLDKLADSIDSAVPLLIGICRDECAPMVQPQDLDTPASGRLLAHVSPATFAALEAAYAHADTDLSPYERRIRALTVEEYHWPTLRLAQGMARAGAPVWMARFDQTVPVQGIERAVHVADLPFWWQTLPMPPGAAPDEVLQLARAMHAALVDFIHGRPPDARLTAPRWPRYTPDTGQMLVWCGEPSLLVTPRPWEQALWAAAGLR